MPFVVDRHHRCYREIFQFFVHNVSLAGHRHPHVLEPGAGVPVLIGEEGDCLVIDGGSPTQVQLIGVRAILDFIKTGENEPSSLKFDYVLGPEHPAHPGLPPVSPGIIPTLCVYLLGYAWERDFKSVKEKQKEQKQSKHPWAFDPDVQFFTHVRNGCFHRGQFDIFPNKIKAPTFPKWRGHEIRTPEQVNGTRVINDPGRPMLNVALVPWVLHDMGKTIDRVLGA